MMGFASALPILCVAFRGIRELLSSAHATWTIAAIATAGVILRPWRLPEAIWAVAGAVLLVLFGLLPASAALRGVAAGTDVYLFLLGMMLLAELARREGLFDWLAAEAARLAKGSGTGLFALIYLVGIIVTIFLSNDATAVVLTPAVAAVIRTVKAKRPLPYLFACAFIANAASFVLPISNPANLVIYGSHMPPLLEWLPRFALPSLLAVAATYAVLRLSQRHALAHPVSAEIAAPELPHGGVTAAIGIAATAIILMVASALDQQLGLPTFLAAIATVGLVLIRKRENPLPLVKEISWSVLALVAGLFVLVEALDQTGLLGSLSGLLRTAADTFLAGTAAGTGAILAFICNVMNNLPAGLIAGQAVQAAHVAPVVSGSVLIGIDLGPNLSITGSLATILWLSALRREGYHVTAWTFLKLGALVMPPALILALSALISMSS